MRLTLPRLPVLLFVTALASGVGHILAAGPAPLLNYTADVAAYLDAAHRSSLGQYLGRDYTAAIGPAAILPTTLAMRLAGPGVRALVYDSALAWAAICLLVPLALLRRRENPAAETWAGVAFGAGAAWFGGIKPNYLVIAAPLAICAFRLDPRDARVVSRDWFNPFPFATGTIPVEGDDIAGHVGRTIGARHHPDADRISARADVIMEPRQSLQPVSLAFKRSLFQTALRDGFALAGESRHWRLWLRRAPAVWTP